MPEPSGPPRTATDRRSLVASALAAGIASTLRLPPAAAAASSDTLSSDVTFTAGFAVGDGRTTLTLNGWGVAITPSVTAPGGTGSPPPSGSVRLVALTILFAGGSGGLSSVSSPGRDVGIYSATTARSGSSVSSDAIGGVIAAWSSATVAGTSDTNTWIRYEFLGGNVVLDVGTRYYIGLISNDTVFTAGTLLRGSQSTGAGTFLVNSSLGTNTSYQVLALASFAS